MCGTRLWGIAGFFACAYLARLSLARVQRGNVDWASDGWSIVTYGVWVLLMAGLLSETRCLRERVFFTLVLANFAMGFGLGIWGHLPEGLAVKALLLAVVLWVLAALASAVVAFSSGTAAPTKRNA
jgi:hypothetical protein